MKIASKNKILHLFVQVYTLIFFLDDVIKISKILLELQLWNIYVPINYLLSFIAYLNFSMLDSVSFSRYLCCNQLSSFYLSGSCILFHFNKVWCFVHVIKFQFLPLWYFPSLIFIVHKRWNHFKCTFRNLLTNINITSVFILCSSTKVRINE